MGRPITLNAAEEINERNEEKWILKAQTSAARGKLKIGSFLRWCTIKKPSFLFGLRKNVFVWIEFSISINQ
jgi:hypothetical protein|tara:strand:+ start:297 stop:509 length:213 start_codon:yes stop_codon:yes gene_type:complete